MSKPCCYKKMVAAYTDNLLKAEKMTFMEKHIEECILCRKELESIRLTEKIIQGMPEIEPSRDFARTFWQKVDEIDASKNKWSFQNLFSGWRPYLITSAAFGLLLLAFTLYQPALIQPAIEDIVLAENMEFFEDYAIIDNLELLENWDIIEHLEEKS